MQTFISHVADYILKKESQLEDCLILLPSKRAGTFLNNQFAKKLNRSSLAPQIYSLVDFIEEHSDSVCAQPTQLILELYQVYKQIEKEEAQPLSEFVMWANTLLQDFNEIDRYLIDSESLFGFLNEAKALESWNINGEELSDFQLKYLSFWKRLAKYYQQFNEHLKKKGLAYSGMQLRGLAEANGSGIFSNLNYQTIYIAGFNAITNAEQQLLNKLSKSHQHEFLWDCDAYYMDDPLQEAGNFLRLHKEKSNTFNWVFNNWNEQKKEIDLYSVSGNIGQTKLMAQLLEKLSEEQKLENTALILADENLLTPVLESIPQSIQAVNVTMGTQLSQSYIYDFYQFYFESLINITQKENDGDFIYTKALLYFLEHPLINQLSKPFQKQKDELIQQVQEGRKTWLSTEGLSPLNEALGVSIFPLKVEINGIIKNLLLLNQCLSEQVAKSGNKIDHEYLAHFELVFIQIIDYQEKYQLFNQIEDVLYFFQQTVSEVEVSFVGEPLSGLQIMGVLESRLLDFERIIFCSLNEGILPAGKSQNSFIPFDIKKKFGLPSYREKDAIYAYHFYRVLQRASHVQLIYNNSTQQLLGGEKSRFISQLMHEIPTKAPQCKLKIHHAHQDLKSHVAAEFEIAKTEETLTKFKSLFTNGISATALNTLIACPQDFYFKYGLGLRVEDSLQEQVESRIYGNILHDSLEELYTPYIGLVMDQMAIKQIKKESEAVLQKHYLLNTKSIPNQGFHFLTYKAAEKYLENLIALDEKEILNGNELLILALESKFERKITIESPYLNEVALKGKIDRIDQLKKQKRIIDYKSGSVYQNELNQTKLEALLENKKPKAVQLMHYLVGLNECEKSQAGIISLQKSQSGFMPLQINGIEMLFNALLESLINELFNKDNTLNHQEDAKYCDFC